MRQTVRLAAFAAGLAAVLCLATAGAQAVDPLPLTEPPHPRRGVEVSVAAGGGGFVDDSSTAFTAAPRAANHLYWPGVALQVWSGYRFVPWLSLGGHFAYQLNTARELPPGTIAGVANSISAGVYARVYIGSALGWRRIEPWLSAGVNPFSTVWADHDTPNGGVRNRFASVSIPVSMGLDYNISDWLAAGVQLQASPWIPFEACASAGPNSTTSACTSSNLATNTYLFAGLGVRVTLPEP